MKNMKRTIDFLNISSFMVEIERIQDRGLKCSPVAIAPLKSDSAKIWDVSSEAKENGITKGMELAVAKRLDRGLKVINPNPDLYKSIHQKLLFEASRVTPLYEGENLGKIYLDFTGFLQLYGNPMDFGMKFKRSIQDKFNLIPRLGIAENKLVSKAATNPYLIKEDILHVPNKSMENFLDPFPNTTLPVVKEMKRQYQNPLFDTFDDLNLTTVLDLKTLDLVTLQAIFPNVAKGIYQMSRGLDFRPVMPPLTEPVLSLDIHMEETNNQTIVLNMLYDLTDRAFSQLRDKGMSTSEIKLAIRYSDFKYLEKVVNLKLPIKYSHESYAELKKALGFLFSRRTSIRYLMIELRKLAKEQIQMGLFEDDNKKLFDALDKINEKFPGGVALGRTVK